MASPEIQLPEASTEHSTTHVLETDKNTEVDEKCHKNDSSSSLDQDPDEQHTASEIVWQYLTWETELPEPVRLSRSIPNASNVDSRPECPDLKKYTSPFLWPESRKSTMTTISCIATVLTAYNAGAYVPGVAQMSEEWHVGEVVVLLGVTLFTCGFGIAPMFLAPFSEIVGRRPVFIVTGLLFVVFQVICAVTPTFAGMLICRFLVGCASSTFSTMVGGVVSDIYHAKDRNTAMTLFSAAALLGTGLGPLVNGFVAQNMSWRWIFYIQIILDVVLMLFVIVFFKETRGSVLLSRKAKTLNKYYDQLEASGYIIPTTTDTTTFSPSSKPSTPHPHRLRYKCKADEERSSIATMLRISLHRPFHLLFTEPVVFFFSLWISFSWGVLYMTLDAIPAVFSRTYGFDPQQSGAVFAALCIGSIVFAFLAVYQEKWGLVYLPAKQRDLLQTPEGRLYFACVESALLPIGVLVFAVAGAYPGCPWIVSAVGIALATIGIGSIYLATFNYLADSYHRYASSALAAQSMCRNFLGGAFPLFTKQMFNAMTFQGAGGFLGGVGFLLTIVPWVLLLNGPKIRARSKLAREIVSGD